MHGLGAVASRGYTNPTRGTDSPPDLPFLDDVRQQIEVATTDIEELTRRVGEFADNTVGPVPSNVAGSGTAPDSISRADQVRSRLLLLSNAISHLRSEVSRLSAI